MLQLKKFPNTRLHSKGSTRVPPTSRGDPFLPPSSRGGILSLRVGEKIPRVPVASQEEAISKGKARRTTESYHHSQSPANVSVIPGKPVFRALLRLSIRGWTHTTVVRGTALWESLEAKPPGKASRESHRSLVPLEWKRYSAATAREESARACPHSRRGLTLLGRLQKYPKIHVSTAEESSGSGTDFSQDLRPRHRREGNPESLRTTRMETGIS